MVSVIYVANSKIIYLKFRMSEASLSPAALTLEPAYDGEAQFCLAGCPASQIPVSPWLLALRSKLTQLGPL